MLECLCPRLRFDEQSFDVIYEHFPNPSNLFDLISKIDSHVTSIEFIKIRGHPGNIREVKKHIHTGDTSYSDMGRLYVRSLAETDGKIWVFVRLKKDDTEQKRTLEKIGNHNLLESY